jgi:hypothetical protein
LEKKKEERIFSGGSVGLREESFIVKGACKGDFLAGYSNLRNEERMDGGILQVAQVAEFGFSTVKVREKQ